MVSNEGFLTMGLLDDLLSSLSMTDSFVSKV